MIQTRWRANIQQPDVVFPKVPFLSSYSGTSLISPVEIQTWKWSNPATGGSAPWCNRSHQQAFSSLCSFLSSFGQMRDGPSLPARFCGVLLSLTFALSLRSYFYWHVLDMYPVTRTNYTEVVVYQATRESIQITRGTQIKPSYIYSLNSVAAVSSLWPTDSSCLCSLVGQLSKSQGYDGLSSVVDDSQSLSTQSSQPCSFEVVFLFTWSM